MNKVQIIIADDHSLVVNGLQLLLKDELWIEVIDIAKDGKKLLGILSKKRPDLILLDINMPKLNGLETARFIKQSYPSIKMLILSTYNEDHLIEKAKQYGVNGYLLKNCDKEDLLQSMRLVMNNQTSFPYRIPKENNLFDKEDRLLKQYNLTKREAEIIQLLKNGFTNQQIAGHLHLSIYTVETHRKNIMQKLQLNSPSELIKFIIQNNL